MNWKFFQRSNMSDAIAATISFYCKAGVERTLLPECMLYGHIHLCWENAILVRSAGLSTVLTYCSSILFEVQFSELSFDFLFSTKSKKYSQHYSSVECSVKTFKCNSIIHATSHLVSCKKINREEISLKRVWRGSPWKLKALVEVSIVSCWFLVYCPVFHFLLLSCR